MNCKWKHLYANCKGHNLWNETKKTSYKIPNIITYQGVMISLLRGEYDTEWHAIWHGCLMILPTYPFGRYARLLRSPLKKLLIRSKSSIHGYAGEIFCGETLYLWRGNRSWYWRQIRTRYVLNNIRWCFELRVQNFAAELRQIGRFKSVTLHSWSKCCLSQRNCCRYFLWGGMLGMLPNPVIVMITTWFWGRSLA